MSFLERELFETRKIPRLSIAGASNNETPALPYPFGSDVDAFSGAAIALGANECSCVKPLIHTAIFPHAPDDLSGGDMRALRKRKAPCSANLRSAEPLPATPT